VAAVVFLQALELELQTHMVLAAGAGSLAAEVDREPRVKVMPVEQVRVVRPLVMVRVVAVVLAVLEALEQAPVERELEEPELQTTFLVQPCFTQVAAAVEITQVLRLVAVVLVVMAGLVAQAVLAQQTEEAVAVVAVGVPTEVTVAPVLLFSRFRTHALQHFLLVLPILAERQAVGLKRTPSQQLQRPQKRSHLAEERHGALCKT
jgi:hypothetical protein